MNRRNVQRTMIKTLVAALAFTQVLPVSYAASTDISDIPMAVTNLVAPNIMFMIDNSGSMQNIVPDAPYNPATTNLTSCPAANTVAGGIAGPGLPAETDRIDIRIEDGVPKLRRSTVSGTTGPSNLTSGTIYSYGNSGSTQRCFDPTRRYNARLYGDSCSGSTCAPSSYLDAIYEGHYLNWYFGSAATSYTAALDYGSGAIRNKPTTKQRLEATKTAAKSVIDSLALNKVRVGLSSYSSATSGDFGELLEIMGDISTNSARMKSKIEALPAFGATPLAETLYDLGGYFAMGNTTGNLTLHPGQTNQSTATTASVFAHTIKNKTDIGGYSLQYPASGNPPDPIQYFCQKSFVTLMTDGRPQADRGISAPLRDYSGDCAAGQCNAAPNTANIPAGSNTTPPNTLTAAEATAAQNGTKAGRGYENQGSDYLDDVAQALFEMDLRPDRTNPSGAAKKNNLATYPISFAEIQLINDPLLRSTADKGQGAAAGQGLNLVASDSSTLVSAFQQVAEEILAKDGSAAAVAVANANVSPEDGNNQSFASNYNSGTWTGDLQSYPIDLTTGQPNNLTPSWNLGCANPSAPVDPSVTGSPPKGCSAQVQLDERTSPRLIATYSGTSGTEQGLQFRANGATGAGIVTTLTPAQQTAISTTPPGTDGNAVVAYLRGDRSGETGTTPPYRARFHVLGDIINAEPVIVSKPTSGYADAGYSAFKTQYGTTTPRARMVYQGANDGMLHAFSATTGAEAWAYIPNLVIPTLNSRTRKSGFQHKFFVDGTPVVGDVDFNNIGINGTGASDWHTMLVGGLGKGGRGFYALDVTQPIASSEVEVVGKVMWEFPNSATSSSVRANIGSSFGKPVIVKIQNRWVVLVTSGYNNGTDTGGSGGDGRGYLFVLDAKTGDLIRAISTSVGTASDPSGLAQVAAYVENANVDSTTTTVYGGDLKGNVWRFNLTGASTDWAATRLAILKDPSNAAQPVTTIPELSKIKVGGAYKRFVYVGTGRYLGESDVATTQVQTMYGLVDDGAAAATINGRATLQQQTVSENAAKERTYSQNTVDFATRKGWYFDLPVSGERSTTDPQLALGSLVFTTNIPSSTPCVPGGSSYINVLDYKTGGNVEQRDVTTGALIASGGFLGDTLASRPVLIKLPDNSTQSGDVKALIRKSDGTTTSVKVPVPPGSLVGKRVSWREVPDR